MDAKPFLRMTQDTWERIQCEPNLSARGLTFTFDGEFVEITWDESVTLDAARESLARKDALLRECREAIVESGHGLGADYEPECPYCALPKRIDAEIGGE